MNKLFLMLICMMVVPSLALTVESEKVQSTHEDELSYSLGYQLGRDLMAAGIEIREEALYQALFAALANDQPELSREEMATYLEEIKGQKK